MLKGMFSLHVGELESQIQIERLLWFAKLTAPVALLDARGSVTCVLVQCFGSFSGFLCVDRSSLALTSCLQFPVCGIHGCIRQ